MTKTEQLDELIAHYADGVKAKFARMLGITPQSLNSWYVNKYIDLKKVFYTCPGVSADWLITGEGEMLKKDRLPVLQEGEKLIPLIKEQDLLSGKWGNLDNYILFRTGESQPDIDFVTRMPNDDLATRTAAGATIGCRIQNTDEFKPEMSYILRTANGGTLFVIYDGYKNVNNITIRNFKTARISRPNMELSIPENDIVQVAEIQFSTNVLSSLQP